MANFMKALLTGFRREGVEILVGMIAEQGVASMPEDWVENVLDHISPHFLDNPDKQKRFSKLASAPFGEHAGKVESVLVETFEELKNRKAALNEDSDNNGKIVREALQTVAARRGGKAPKGEKSKDQGDKVQKPATPDYFTAKAAIKDDTLREKLSKIEQAMKVHDAEAYQRFMRAGAYRIRTTPEELLDIAKVSEEPDHAYGVERLKSLMSGQRGEGGVGGKLKSFTEDLVDDVFHGGGIDQAAANFDVKVGQTSADVKAATDKRRRCI
ncbi:hypothetical protein IT087_00785 [Candidatus Uhrbacteria bacterium]|nr:hypothetical protein [Candidatus Uhrbacteria bacterium]